MFPTACPGEVLVLPPAYHRRPQRRRPALQLDARALVTRLHLLSLCRLAVRLGQRRCRDESLLLLALLRTLWRLSYRDLHDWLVAWPALAFACGLPADASGRVLVPSASQQGRRGAQPGAPVCESLLVVLVRLARYRRLIQWERAHHR